MDPYAAQTYPPNQDPYLYNQPPQYPYYPQYPNPNPNPQEHAPIHPPGVPIQNDPNHIAAYHQAYVQPQFQHDPNSYYAQQQQQQPPHPVAYSDPGLAHQGQQQQWQQPGQTVEYGLTAVYPPNGQGAPGRGGGRGLRGGGSSTRGRGRGGGRGGKTAVISQPKPQCMAWCELCRVDCNTLEILENHKNGKKHKKNLKIQEELQKLAAKTQETQMAAAAAENAETACVVDGMKAETTQAAATEGQGNNSGLKRKMGGERKSTEPSKKQKEIVPFICELCNVKCESAPTFDSHLKGKKHGFNLQRFQEQQATLGQVALQALYPALEALYPALLQAIANNVNNTNASSTSTTVTGGGGLDQQLLQWLQPYLPQNGALGLGGLPQGPDVAPAGPAQEAPTEVGLKTEEKVEPEIQTESKDEEAQVKTDVKDAEAEVKTEATVDVKDAEAEVKTVAMVDLKDVEPEVKTESTVDVKDAQPTE